MQPTSSSFTPDELSNAKMQYSAFRASQKPTSNAQPTAKKGPSGIKGVLNNLLPIAGGALGALAGVPLGPAGIIAGGAAGSAIGEGFKEHNNGEKLSVKNIAGQAALGGLPGVGSGIKVLRAGEGAAALIGRGAATAGETAATTAVTKPSLATKIYNKGIVTEARTGGFGQGEKLAGGETQGFRKTEKNVQTLANEGIPRSNATSRQIATGDRLTQHADAMTTAVKANNPAVTDVQKAELTARIKAKLLGKNGQGATEFDPTNKAQAKYVANFDRQLNDIQDAQGSLNFTRSLDNAVINHGRSSAAANPVKEQIARIYRTEVRNDFNKAVPEAKAASDRYAKLHDANEFLKQAARDQSNAATQPGGSLTGRLLTSDTAQTVKTKTGGAMQSLGKLMGAKTEAPGVAPTASATPALAVGKTAQVLQRLTSPVQFGKAALKQGAYRGAAGLLTGQPAPQQATADAVPIPDTTGGVAGDLTSGVLPTNTSSTPDTMADSKYPEAAYMSDIQRDPKNSAQYTAVFNELNPNYGKTPSNGLNVTKVTAQQYGLAQSGAQEAQQLNQMIQDNPSVVAKSGAPGQGLPFVGGYVSNALGTASYQSAAYSLADKYLKLTTGATSNDSEIKNTANKLIPRAGDTPQVIQDKLEYLHQYFGNVLQLAGNGGTQDASTSDLAAGQ